MTGSLISFEFQPQGVGNFDRVLYSEVESMVVVVLSCARKCSDEIEVGDGKKIQFLLPHHALKWDARPLLHTKKYISVNSNF